MTTQLRTGFQAIAALVQADAVMRIRTVAPDFRLTRGIRFALIAATIIAAIAVGAIAALLLTAAPALVRLWRISSEAITSLPLILGVGFSFHHLLSMAAREARESWAPGDSPVLAAAGLSRFHVVLSRTLFPLAATTLSMITVLLFSGAVSYRGYPSAVTTITVNVGLGVSLVTSVAVARGTATCLLATAATVNTSRLRLLLWTPAAALGGAVLTGILLPILRGRLNVAELLTHVLTSAQSSHAQVIVAGAAVFLLIASTIGIIHLRRQAWTGSPMQSTPPHSALRLPLPRHAWGTLAALPLTSPRSTYPGDFSEFLRALSLGILALAFGCGAVLANPNAFHFPRDVGLGAIAVAPLIAVGLHSGVVSLNAVGPLLPHLHTAVFPAWKIHSAVATSILATGAILSLPSLPFALLLTDVAVSKASWAWLTATVTSPGVLLIVDSFFPAPRLIAGQRRIRQHPAATLLSAGGGAGISTVIVTANAYYVPPAVVTAAGLITTVLVCTLLPIPRPIRGIRP